MLSLLTLLACTSNDGGNLVDDIWLPDPAAVEWVDGVHNPYFPLPVNARWSYEGETDEGLETDEVEVLDETRDVNGVVATVAYDVVYLDGAMIEETWDWYAEDSEGNVWYLGEDTCEYEDGKCAVHTGSWEWGVDGAEPGIIMLADPKVDGQPYFQEYYEGIAEDVGEVIATGESADAPAGSFDACIRTEDTSHIDAKLLEEKVYCAGVGNVYVHEPDTEVWLLSTAGL
jgi:hypothetical protein